MRESRRAEASEAWEVYYTLEPKRLNKVIPFTYGALLLSFVVAVEEAWPLLALGLAVIVVNPTVGRFISPACFAGKQFRQLAWGRL